MASHLGVSSSILDDELEEELSAMPTWISVEMEGKTARLKQNQISTMLLSKVFRLMPDSILLCNNEGEIESPNESGLFKGLASYYTYSCIGEPIPDCPTPSSIYPYAYGGPSSFMSGSKVPMYSVGGSTARYSGNKGAGKGKKGSFPWSNTLDDKSLQLYNNM